ncbi:MAG: electron transfer flavoprotein subunit beta/FixA family protein [Acidimicrobiales bacterium]|jgi:electron transfer flavoprotein beta subunit
MNVLVCIKRVPDVGAKITLTPDAQDLDTHLLGFTVSPHEECAIEEAVRIVELRGGTVSVLTLGPPDAAEQLRDAAAIGAGRLLLLETDGREWGPMATAGAIVEAVRSYESTSGPYELILFGNEAADTGDYQVAVRVAHALNRPCVTGVKHLQISEATLRARREFRGGDEYFELALPAVVSVKEGINLPRYPSLPGRMRAKKAVIEQTTPEWQKDPVHKQALRDPIVERQRAEILGEGVEAVPALLGLLEQLGVFS